MPSIHQSMTLFGLGMTQSHENKKDAKIIHTENAPNEGEAETKLHKNVIAIADLGLFLRRDRA